MTWTRGSTLAPLRRRRRTWPKSARLSGSNKLKQGLLGLRSRPSLSALPLLWPLPWNVPFLERRTPFGIWRLGRGSTLMLRAMTMINRLTADSADRNSPDTFR